MVPRGLTRPIKMGVEGYIFILDSDLLTEEQSRELYRTFYGVYKYKLFGRNVFTLYYDTNNEYSFKQIIENEHILEPLLFIAGVLPSTGEVGKGDSIDDYTFEVWT